MILAVTAYIILVLALIGLIRGGKRNDYGDDDESNL